MQKLDLNWINNIRINLSAVERRTATLVKRRSVKKDHQAAWLLKAIKPLRKDELMLCYYRNYTKQQNLN